MSTIKRSAAAFALALCCAGTAATAGVLLYFLLFERPHLSYKSDMPTRPIYARIFQI